MKNKLKDCLVELGEKQKHYRELADYSRELINSEEMVVYWLGHAFATDEAIKLLKAIVGEK